MLTCSIAYAGWEFAGQAANGKFDIFVDKSTIRKSGALVKMWTMSEYSSNQTNSNELSFKSDKTLFGFNCVNETTVIISLVQFSSSMGDGAVVYSGSRKESELDWRPIVPQGVDELLWKIACSKK